MISHVDFYNHTKCGRLLEMLPHLTMLASWLLVTDMFRTGVLHISDAGCALVLQADLEYWGVDESSMEACCTLKYYPKIEVSSPVSISGQFLIFIINNLARCVSLRGTGRSPPRDKRWSWRRRRTSVTQTGDVCDPFSGTRWNTPGPAPGPHYAISISCRI